MKKLAAFFIMTAVMSVGMLSGCGRKNENTYNAKTDYQYQFDSYDDAFRHNLTTDEDGNLYYLNGYYIYKYDVEAGTNAPLCNKQNCLHDKETDIEMTKKCNAYFPYMDGLDRWDSIAYEDGYIYATYSGYDDKMTDASKVETRTILKISIDGSSREKIHTFHIPINREIFHRGNYYFTKDVYDENNVETISVCSYPLKGTGRETTIWTAPRKADGKEIHYYGIQGYEAYGNYLYFQTHGDIDGKTNFAKYYVVDLKNGEVSELKTNDMKASDFICTLTFINNRMIFDVFDGDNDSSVENGRTYQAPVYTADLDGTHISKQPFTITYAYNMYSDGEHLIISDDNIRSVEKLLKVVDKASDTAEYKVYDREFRLVDTYKESLKPEYEYLMYEGYYAQLGPTDKSFYVKRNYKDGTAELYVGNKDQIGTLNGKTFKRKLVAKIAQSPSVKHYLANPSYGNVWER